MLLITEFPPLETKNLVLRQIVATDSEAVFELFSDLQVVRFHDVTPFVRLQQAESLVNRWAERFRNQQGIRWGIARKEDNIIIGSCGFGAWNKRCLRAEIGYELAKTHWRQGIMSEALTAVLDFGFQSMELNRIEAMVMMENLPSMKLLQKLGFREEGILREHGFWIGQFHDLKIFSFLKNDYKSKL